MMPNTIENIAVIKLKQITNPNPKIYLTIWTPLGSFSFSLFNGLLISNLIKSNSKYRDINT